MVEGPPRGLWSGSMFDGRIYRAAFVPLLFVLVIAGFSLARPARVAALDTCAGRVQRRTRVRRFCRRSPGASRAADRAASAMTRSPATSPRRCTDWVTRHLWAGPNPRRRRFSGHHAPTPRADDRRRSHAHHRGCRTSWVHRVEPDRDRRPPRRRRARLCRRALGHRCIARARARVLPERDSPHDRARLYQRR